MRRRLPLRVAVLAAALLALVAGSCAAAAVETPEDRLVAAIEALRGGNAQQGFSLLSALVAAQPNFRLAQLLYGDLLAVRSGKGGAMADEQNPRVRELSDEARLRLQQARFLPPPGTVPDTVLQLADEYPYLVLVDLPRARLYLMQNQKGSFKLMHSSYAAMGRNGYGKAQRGDFRTPLGIYHTTGWTPDEALPDLYGAGALPLNYPNLWDQFRAKTGSGIWLHGVPQTTYVRAPRSSEGCVTMANEDLLSIRPYAATRHAPVVLSDAVEWIPEAQAKAQRDAFLARVEAWRKAWSSKDTEAYLAYYGDDFSTQGMGKKEFAAHKRRVNAGKKYVNVKLSDISLFRYPGEPMWLAEFTIDYKSDNFSMSAKKEQYWRLDAQGDWKIFREENR